MESHRLADRVAKSLSRAVRLRCPRCGTTALFRGWFSMAEACALCGLRFERAQGYFVGAIYINYAVTAILALGGFFLLWGLTALSTAAQLGLPVPGGLVSGARGVLHSVRDCVAGGRVQLAA